MSKGFCASLFFRLQVTLAKVGMGERGGVEIADEDGGIGEVEEQLRGTWNFGGLGPLVGALQPLESFLDAHFFGGYCIFQTSLFCRKNFIEKVEKEISSMESPGKLTERI
jgi:hypothetical protein